MQYQFFRPVTVQGVPYKGGDVVDESDIPAGSLECLSGFARPYEPPPAVETPVEAPAKSVVELTTEPVQIIESVPVIEVPKAAEKPFSHKRKGK